MAHESLVKEGKTAINKGIRPDEVEDYFRKKGMDKKEAHDATTKLNAEKIIADRKAEKHKSTESETAPSQGKSLFFWLIVLIVIGVIVYLFYIGRFSIGEFFNLN